MSDSLQPHVLQPIRLLRPWDFPGKSAGVDCHFLFQGIFPTQESNPGLPHCRRILYQLSHQGRMFKLLHNCTHFTCWQSNAQNPPSQASTVHEHELSDVQAEFRKGRRTRDQIANILWIIEKAKEFQKKKSTFASLIMLKPLTVWITANCEKFFKRQKYQTT